MVELIEMDKSELNIEILKPMLSTHELDIRDVPLYLKVGDILKYHGKYIDEEESGISFIEFTDYNYEETEFFSPDEFNRLIKERFIKFI